jgi:hypothetical protein
MNEEDKKKYGRTFSEQDLKNMKKQNLAGRKNPPRQAPKKNTGNSKNK